MHIDFKTIDHVQLSIPKGYVGQARDFYCGILGLKEIPRPEALASIEGFWLEIANTRIHIAAEENVCKTRRHPAFIISEIENVKTYLKDKGVKIKDDQEIPGLIRFSLFDPWDNRIELIQEV